MQPSDKKSSELAESTEKPAEPHIRNETYELHYASERVEKEFTKAFKKIPKDDVDRIKKQIASLRSNPRQAGKKTKQLQCNEQLGLAQYRLRIGQFRVQYDIDEEKKRVVLLLIARRNERTY